MGTPTYLNLLGSYDTHRVRLHLRSGESHRNMFRLSFSTGRAAVDPRREKYTSESNAASSPTRQSLETLHAMQLQSDWFCSRLTCGSSASWFSTDPLFLLFFSVPCDRTYP